MVLGMSMDSNPSQAPDPSESPDSPPAAAPDRVRQFMHTLAGFTPRVLVTPTLVGLNLAMFGVMVASGVSPFSPTAEVVARWGATFGPFTASGQWWRLFSAMFIHIGLLHVAMNMWVLWMVGPLVERILGHAGFGIVYLLSGVAGGLASLWWSPMAVSAGASGAVFGVYGVLLAFLVRKRRAIPLQVLRGLRSSTLVFVGFNLLFGLVHKGVDMGAHVGGLAGGFVFGLPLCHPLTAVAWSTRWRRNILVLVLGGSMLAGIAFLLRNDGGHLQRELERFVQVEQRVVDRYNVALRQVRERKMSDGELVRVLRSEVIGPWRAARQRIEGIRKHGKLPALYVRRAERLLSYMRLREQGWALLCEALVQQDREKADRATRMQRRAERALKMIEGRQ